MKLKEGMYVRTLDGISKVIEVREDDVMSRFVNKDGNVYFDGDMMCNPSYDLVDLIEVGDVIVTKDKHKFEVYEVDLEERCVIIDLELNGEPMHFYEEDIKSIVTKEQFNQMKYEVGEDK